MKKVKGDLVADQKKYLEAASIIENKFSFLVSDYGFTFQKGIVIYGVYISYATDKFSFLMCYGAPEFTFSAAIIFPLLNLKYNLGQVAELNFYQWSSDWVPNISRNDHLRFEMEMTYIFIKNNMKTFLTKNEETAQELKARWGEHKNK